MNLHGANLTVLAIVCLGFATDVFAVGTRTAEDTWLAKIAMDELSKCEDAEQYQELGGRVQAAILARLSLGLDKGEDISALTGLVYVQRACKYAAEVEKIEGGTEFYKWLLSKRPLARLMLRAMRDVTRPDEALEALKQLKEADEGRVLGYLELTTAFATTREASPLYGSKQLHPASMLDSFRYYTGKRKLRYDLKKMPYELSRYLTDTNLSLKERLWAMGRYWTRGNLATTYGDLRYDTAHLRTGAPKRIDRIPFTLPNLRKVGGVCIEQAYFAAEVCKALGVPATIVTGRGGTGTAHAWVACLKIASSGKKAVWDAKTGRYEEHKYYTGQLQAPATGKSLLDSELMLLGAAALLPLDRREQSDAACALAKMVAEVAHENKSADVGELKRLAKLHNERFSNETPVDQAKLEPAAELNMAMVEDLLEIAIARNLAQREAWDFIVSLRRRDLLKVENLDRFFNVLITKTAKAYPDYSCEMVMKIVPTIDDGKNRMGVYKKATGIYVGRPDLQGRLLMATGDDYLNQNKRAAALKLYQMTATRHVKIAEVVVPAARKAETLLVEVGHRKKAISMYKKLFARTKKERSIASEQTAYYRLGVRLAELLAAEGKDDEAEKIRKRIESKK